MDASSAFELRKVGTTYKLFVKDPSLFNYETATNHQVAVTVYAQDGTIQEDGTTIRVPKTITFTLANVVETPTNIDLSGSRSINENATNGRFVGNLSAIAPAGGAINYFISGDTGAFEIVDNSYVRVKDGTKIDYDQAGTITLKIAASVDGEFAYKDFVFTIVDQPENPHNIALFDQTSIRENAPGAVVGELFVSDDASDLGRLVWSVTGPAATQFEVRMDIAGKHYLKLKDGISLDYEALPSPHTIDVTVAVTDPDTGASTSRVFAVQVSDAVTVIGGADTPTNLPYWDNDVGITPFSAVTFSTGDNSLITVTINLDTASEGELKNLLHGGTFEAGVYRITNYADLVQQAVRALQFDPTDRPNDAVYSGQATTFTIRVSENASGVNSNITITTYTQNRNPTNISLSATSIKEQVISGTEVGILGATDPNAGDTAFTYKLINNTGKPFSLSKVGNVTKLVTSGTVDYESTNPLLKTITDQTGTHKYYEVTVEVTDGFGGTTTKTFDVVVEDVSPDVPVNHAPLIGGADLPVTSPYWDTDFPKPFKDVTVFDEDGNPLTVTITLDSNAKGIFTNYESLGGTFVNGVYKFQGSALALQNTLQALIFDPTDRPNDVVAAGQAVNFTIAVSDGSETTTNSNITLGIHAANRAPYDITLSGTSVTENVTGAVIGTLTGFDTNSGDAVTVALALDGDPSGRFEVVNGVLKLKDGVSLDYETATSYEVGVRVSDGHGGLKDGIFTIFVQNVVVEPRTGTPIS